jgi:predicted nuclease of restriction endonuclease-like (RecB) superfamily
MASDSASFGELVSAIRQADQALRSQALRAVNTSLTLRNWFIGWRIAEFELHGADRARYGDKLVPELATALSEQGVSNTGRRQLYAYLAFYRAYPQMVRTASALSLVRSTGLALPELPGGKVRTLSALSGAAADAVPAVDPELLLTRLSYSHLEQLVELGDPSQRSFYTVEALRGQWSVRELKRQIATQYYQRSGLSTRPQALADLTQAQAQARDGSASALRQVVRDPYVFEFLGLKPQEVVSEGQLEDALLDKLQAFLLELGHGFCFEARQSAC